MTKREFKERLAAENFSPFTLVMNNGERYDVPHPEWVIVTGLGTVHVYPPLEEDPEYPDPVFSSLAMHNISSLEPLRESPAGNR